MAMTLEPAPVPPVPALGHGWTLRPADDTTGHARRTYIAALSGEPVAHLEIHRVRRHPVRACYPYGAHDLLLDLTVHTPGPAGSGLLRELVPALFSTDPHCRRIIAAPAEDDTLALLTYERGGLRRVTEADLPGGTVVLLTAEPPQIAHLSTALDDMPH